MNKQLFIELAEKISTGVATDPEIAQFNRWYQSFQKDGEEWLEAELGDKDKIEAALLRGINRRISHGAERRISIIYPLRKIAAAIIILMLAAGGLYWYFSGIDKSPGVPDLVIHNDVQPGGDKAVLTLGDGSRIVLDEAGTGLLASEGSTSVNKAAEGLITYQADKADSEIRDQNSKKISYNTISTPDGGQYKVVLPDETEVWLNAMSSIRFPTQFTGKTREVEITGEVYFDVITNVDQPFWVHSGDQVVKVLGTQFNIQAYSDEDAIRTTLVEGSVIVESKNSEIKIEPGQQAINNNSPTFKVEEVDTERVIAWKNGLFQFWSTDLQEIMRQLERWYDIDVKYLNSVKGQSYTGFISRDVPISSVLRMLEEAGNVQFGLEGNMVSVKIGKDSMNKSTK